MYGEGISRNSELVDLGVKLDLVQKSGSWYSYKRQSWQGKKGMSAFLKENPDVAEELEAALRTDFFKLMGSQSLIAAKAAGRAVGDGQPPEGEEAGKEIEEAHGDEDFGTDEIPY